MTLKPIKRPMTLAEVRRAIDADNRVKAVVAFDLHDLTDNDIEGFNDLAESRILTHGILSDIGYTIVGHVPASDNGAGEVLIEVDAEVDLSLYSDEDQES